MINFREEKKGDADGIRFLLKEAFGQNDEADLVDLLRENSVPVISIVAMNEDVIAGHILFSPVKVQSITGLYNAMALGPLAVLSCLQNKGIGSKLTRLGLAACQNKQEFIIFVIGHPGYYPKFGFIPAREWDIRSEFDIPDEAFMALELKDGLLNSCRDATVIFRPEFQSI